MTRKNLDRAKAADLRHLGHDGAAASGLVDDFNADAVGARLLDDAHIDHAVNMPWS
ncbi:hypothetical protein [Streptomyces sp. NPDC052107]|uniref:hypothetical protein n=1 Tax=Streptomyces sp. NPDC052107 TaxID=3155632 RepID=UPI0034290FF0